MKTKIVAWHRHLADDHGLEARATAAAVKLLRQGEIVALPTETVYGLAADALDPIAVAKIFEAKGRPRFDPLIVHLPEYVWLDKLVDLSTHDRQLVLKLAEAFWPGPFTMVLRKRSVVSQVVTAGLDTVAVRISAHPVFAAVVQSLGKPLAAPSANRFGRVSPTTAQHVLDELGGRIPLILDAGPTQHGIESTIAAVHEGRIEILRRGPITEEELRGIGLEPVFHRQDADATTARRNVEFRAMPDRQDADATTARRNVEFRAMSDRHDADATRARRGMELQQMRDQQEADAATARRNVKFRAMPDRHDADATRASRGVELKQMRDQQEADATRARRGMGFQPMDPYQEISIRRGAHLPHWGQTDATYAVTFRLADALPKQVLAEWKSVSRDILVNARKQKRDLIKAEERQLAKLFSQKVERYLDAGHGKCWLRDERVAKIVRDALLHFDGERYQLFAWCIMPNHVHVIVRPTSGRALSEILHTWKSFAANKANRLLNRKGAFWQLESYDHLVRTEQDLRNQIRYVLENPAKAGLKSWPWVGRGMGFEPVFHRLEADATTARRNIEFRAMPDRQDADATAPKRGTGSQSISHRKDADATAPKRDIEFQTMLDRRDAGATIVRAPGQLSSHYAPRTPFQIVGDAKLFSPKENQRVALLAWNPIKNDSRFVAIRKLSARQDLREAAANLFRYLHELDALDLDLIVAERVPDQGLGAAINDRLERASGRGD